MNRNFLYGDLIDEDGRLVNKDDDYVDEDGNLVDVDGHKLTKDGDYDIEFKGFIDDDGNTIMGGLKHVDDAKPVKPVKEVNTEVVADSVKIEDKVEDDQSE